MRQFLPVLALSAGLTSAVALRPGSDEPVRRPGASMLLADRGLFAPVVGSVKRYVVRPGDTLLRIARRSNADAESLARLNRLDGGRVKPGRILLLPSKHILPSVRRSGIVLNIPERGVYLFRHGRLAARFPVAVGMRTWETPTGTYKVVRKVKNPTWIPPKAMVRREGIPVSLVRPGPKNPLGDRWIGWSAPEVGFHSTSLVDTVGKLASHACVRMYPESAHRLYDSVPIGTPIYAEYEPVKLGKQDGVVYLSVSPDVYHRHKLSLESVRLRLDAAGLAGQVDDARVRRIMARKDGYPWPIAWETPVVATSGPAVRIASKPAR